MNKRFSFLLLPLLLVSCINFSGKLDSVGAGMRSLTPARR